MRLLRIVSSGGRTWNARLAAVAVAAGMWLVSGAAVAGDFYLRGGLGLDRPGSTSFTDRDCVVDKANYTRDLISSEGRW